MIRIFVLSFVVFSFMFVSCTRKPGNPTVIHKNNGVSEKQPIPKSLDKLDKNSEDIYQSLLNREWTRAESDYQKVQSEFYSLSPYLKEDSIPVDYLVALEFAVKDLDNNIKNKNQTEALTDANNITSYMCDVADYFITDYPSNLRRIHVFTRNIEIDALQDKWEEAKENLEKINAFWPKVKDLLSAKSVEKVKAFEESLNDFDVLLNKKDLSKVLKRTQIIRDRIADLEKYYEN